MLLVDDLAAGGTKILRHTPRGLVTLRQMVHICLHLCCFLSILKTTPNISSLTSFYSSRRKCTERLGASLYALISFRATSNAIQGRILKFLSGCGEGGPSLCRKST